MPGPKTAATHYHAQLGHPDKDHAIKGLVICNIMYVSALGPTFKA